jgi:hypothetical protein
LSGANMPAYFECAFQEYTAGRVSRIRTLRPLSDATSGLTVTLDARARLGDASGAKSSAQIMTSGLMPVRSAGRYIAPRLDYAAGSAWTYAQGVELDVATGGGR